MLPFLACAGHPGAQRGYRDATQHYQCFGLCGRRGAQQSQTTATQHCNPLSRAQGTKVNSKGKEMPHGTRLYSIAATRYGDTFDGNTTSLCVRRATFWDNDKGADDPEKKGICSNFLCAALSP